MLNIAQVKASTYHALQSANVLMVCYLTSEDLYSITGLIFLIHAVYYVSEVLYDGNYINKINQPRQIGGLSDFLIILSTVHLYRNIMFNPTSFIDKYDTKIVLTTRLFTLWKSSQILQRLKTNIKLYETTQRTNSHLHDDCVDVD